MRWWRLWSKVEIIISRFLCFVMFDGDRIKCKMNGIENVSFWKENGNFILNKYKYIYYIVLLKEIVEKETLIEYIGLMEKMDIDISTSKNK